jgi:hypothetical protein
MQFSIFAYCSPTGLKAVDASQSWGRRKGYGPLGRGRQPQWIVNVSRFGIYKGEPREGLCRMTQLASHRELELFKRVAEIIESARGRVARSVNSAMVQAYWLIGREIVEIEQQGKKRAGYGDRIIQGLAAKLTAEFGSGYSIPKPTTHPPVLPNLSRWIGRAHLAGRTGETANGIGRIDQQRAG